MKKLTAIFMVSAMILSLASCGKNESDKENSGLSSAEKSTSATEETTKTEEETEISTEKETDSPDDKNNSETPDINDYITVDSPTPALWKATDPDSGNELYLMGTIHVVSEEKFSLPDYIMDVYENSSGVAVEYDIRQLEEISGAQELLQYTLYTDGTKISDHISEEAYETGKSCLTDLGMYAGVLDYYMPGLWLNQIEQSAIMSIKNLSSDGVDSKFIDMAEKDGKEIVSIETLEIQADALVGYSDEYADYCIRTLPEDLQDIEELAESLGKLYDLWASGKIDEMEEFSDESADIPEDLLDDYEEYNEKILYSRNKGMADKAAEFLENGDNYFFMVGAMHFAGSKGVDDLLEDKGYTVERLY